MNPETSLGCEFAVASQLFFKGYYASITLKNYPRTDIFAVNLKTGKSVALNVRAVGTEKVFPKSDDDGITKVFVDAHDTKSLKFYVVPSKQEVGLFNKIKRELESEGKKANHFVTCDFSYLREYEDKWDLMGI